ncbi:Fimbrial assembly protein (PilN) [compost metagenome]
MESARLFGMLQELIPADAWLTETRVEPDKPLTLIGYALSRTAPVSFAEVLGREGALSAVTVPEITQEEREGTTVYRFTITAVRGAAQGGHHGQ